MKPAEIVAIAVLCLGFLLRGVMARGLCDGLGRLKANPILQQRSFYELFFGGVFLIALAVVLNEVGKPWPELGFAAATMILGVRTAYQPAKSWNEFVDFRVRWGYPDYEQYRNSKSGAVVYAVTGVVFLAAGAWQAVETLRALLHK